MQKKSERKVVLMLGTDLETKGGISSVVNVYRSNGFFEKWNTTYIPTSCDGAFIVKFSRAIFSFLRYIGILLTSHVQLIHVHMASRASFWRKFCFIQMGFLLRIPVLIHLHGGEFHIFYGRECSLWKKKIVRYVFEKANRVVVLSHRWAEWAQNTFSAANVSVVYNPVIYRRNLTFDSRKEAEILFLGRLGESKGTMDLMDAVSRLTRSHPKIKLLLGGDGDLDGARSRAQELGIAPRVDILGWVKGDEKEKLLLESTVYALPSYNEGLPMSILEAMAAGLPVVSTKVGGIPEAVRDGVEGFLIEPGDVKALTRRLDMILSDRTLQTKMADAGRKKIEAVFSAQKVVPQMEKLYSAILKRQQVKIICTKMLTFVSIPYYSQMYGNSTERGPD
jgi:glycosyltransferase involved in cell wall biosynthesis